MTLQFVVRVNKHAKARIGVLRAVFQGNKIDHYDTLGTLKGLDETALDNFARDHGLDETEQYQLFNYAEHVLFNENECKTPVEKLKREFVYYSPEYERALMELWHLAKKHKVTFCPAGIQQSSLLYKAKAVERTLSKLLHQPVNILEKIGIDIRRFDKDTFELKKTVSKTSKKLFTLLLTIPVSHEQLCQEFNTMAKVRYNKNVSLRPHYFKDYANTLKRLPFWYNTVAIDLLLHHHIDPLKSISLTEVVENWARLRKDTLPYEIACLEFQKAFKASGLDKKIMDDALKQEYDQKISTANE